MVAPRTRTAQRPGQGWKGQRGCQAAWGVLADTLPRLTVLGTAFPEGEKGRRAPFRQQCRPVRWTLLFWAQPQSKPLPSSESNSAKTKGKSDRSLSSQHGPLLQTPPPSPRCAHPAGEDVRNSPSFRKRVQRPRFGVSGYLRTRCGQDAPSHPRY